MTTNIINRYSSHVMELGPYWILPLVHLMVQAVVLYNVMQLLIHRMVEHHPLALMEHWVALKVGAWLNSMAQMVTHAVTYFQEGRVVQMVMDIVMYLHTDRMI